MKETTSLSLALVLLLSGCSDPKAASESNFKKAAQAYLDSVYPKCYVTQTFPYTTTYHTGRKDTGDLLHALVKAGLLAEKELSRQKTDGWMTAKGDDFIVKSTFELTEEGRKHYKSDGGKPMGYDAGGYCAGKAEVDEIVRYTEPSDALGTRISRVNYTYRVKDLPKWALTPELVAVVPALKQDVESKEKPVKVTEGFVLTNEGWIHQSLFKD
ncbi:hypothetical protein [Noviherbaspirillum aridicola]|uniref:Lipoprotein n=1 Tax=Noviherbaspirillum aridicola TaxID=2849687 RepID=A0ABQ4Q556_9BURK|nr:hypothetical protein [Noviherbaspirillum aridicola]GIZ51874.1 hypothetical protein NCCP691_18880 [Noviherbaspirillum aridicola]